MSDFDDLRDEYNNDSNSRDDDENSIRGEFNNWPPDNDDILGAFDQEDYENIFDRFDKAPGLNIDGSEPELAYTIYTPGDLVNKLEGTPESVLRVVMRQDEESGEYYYEVWRYDSD